MPSGFDIELGSDCLEIDDDTWSMRYYDKTAGSANEIWGHHWQPLELPSSLRPIAAASSGQASSSTS